MNKWITYYLTKQGKRTNVWHVMTKYDILCLGEIRWLSRWRTYAFFPSPDIVLEDDCLFDIANFIKRQMDERKSK